MEVDSRSEAWRDLFWGEFIAIFPVPWTVPDTG